MEIMVYLCDHTSSTYFNTINTITMNSFFFPLFVGLVSGACLLSSALYAWNLKYRKQIQAQSEEIERLGTECRKLRGRAPSSAPTHPIKELERQREEQEVKALLRQTPFEESNWTRIEAFVNATQDRFTERLTEKFPQLTQEDVHTILLIRLSFDNKEIADFYHIRLSSLHTRRYRLKRKLGLEGDISVDEYIRTMFDREEEEDCA